MTYKLFGILLFTLISCATCFGQSSFQGLTPGTSTRNDVARVLGQPVRTISTTRFEYSPPAEIARVEVEYGAGSSVVERLEVYFLKPISRPALIKQFNLPDQADSRITDAEGKLLEYFGGESLLVLTYAAADESSGASRVGYYSRELFNSIVSTDTEPGDAATTRAKIGAATGAIIGGIQREERGAASNSTSGRGGGNLTVEYDTDRPGADYRDFDLSDPGYESCRDACAGDPKCKAYTYVKPGVQGPNARCWLKTSVPDSGSSACCVSGVKR
jgi:hypothetical protein